MHNGPSLSSGKWTLTDKKCTVTVNGTTTTWKSTARKVLEKGTYLVMVKSTNATSGLGGNAYAEMEDDTESDDADAEMEDDTDWK